MLLEHHMAIECQGHLLPSLFFLFFLNFGNWPPWKPFCFGLIEIKELSNLIFIKLNETEPRSEVAGSALCFLCLVFRFWNPVILSALSVGTHRLLSSDPLYYDERNAHKHEDETQCHKHHRLENINGSEKKEAIDLWEWSNFLSDSHLDLWPRFQWLLFVGDDINVEYSRQNEN